MKLLNCHIVIEIYIREHLKQPLKSLYNKTALTKPILYISTLLKNLNYNIIYSNDYVQAVV